MLQSTSKVSSTLQTLGSVYRLFTGVTLESRKKWVVILKKKNVHSGFILVSIIKQVRKWVSCL